MKATTPLLSAVCLLSFLPGSAPAQLTLVPAGSTWKYLDNGTDEGTAWRQSAFDDSAWASGPAQLGYGDGDEQTVVAFGPSSTAKYITTYFRRSFTVTDPTQLAGLKLEILRDDGAVIYLNGTEVARTNMPAGTVTATTPASSAVTGTDETTTFHSFTLNPSALLSGTNVVAVEIHQDSGTSSDISFDLRLTDGVVPLGFVRSPYLQSVSPSAATIRWRTTIATDTRLRFGTAPGALDQTIVVSGSRTEHSVELSGLSPETRYYYAAGTSAGDLAGGEPYFVTTHPPAGTARKTRFWVLGDCGTGDANAIAVRNAFQQFNGNASTNLLLMLGDNAYNNGTDEEMTRSLFQIHPDTLRNTPLWPTLGNHDAVYSDSPTQTGPYFNSFTLPVNGSSGGVASGTEAYYSFDYANVHVICLDSQDTPRSTTGAMYQWLQNDLAATSQEWIIAFFHHPPYTKGTHDSDSSTDSSGRMTQMRSVFLPLLESYGVDLVLSGHSHTYERSFLLDGHYGLSSTFDAASMIRDNSGGDPDGSGTYVKRPIPRDGAVYVVAGSSGKVGTGTLNHPAMFVSMSKLGSLVLDVNGNELLARFITSTGTVADTFGIRHEEAPSTPTALTASASDASVALDWADNTEADLAGYDVLRATSADGTYSKLTTVTTSSWNDASVTNGTTYHYKVAAVDSYGYASEPSNPVSATPADNTPPAAPTGLAATAGNATVALDWTDSTEADLAGYRVFRSNVSGSGFSLVASPSASTFTDNSVSNGSTYFYTVAAIDTAGNISAPSSQISATPTAPLTAIWSERIDMGIGLVKGKYRASAGVNVLRSGNTAAARATVTGTWSLNGTVIGTASAITSRSGLATLYSPQVNATKGSLFTFTITGITLSGLQYNPALNKETSDSIAVP
jgi:fibronectin type 3 domain-containing protein